MQAPYTDGRQPHGADRQLRCLKVKRTNGTLHGHSQPFTHYGDGRAPRCSQAIPLIMHGDIACHSCDLLLNVAALKDGETASCPRCGGFLTRVRADAYSRISAYATAALILLVLANSYSFLAFSASGLENDMTLLQTPGALWQNGMPELALLLGAFIIVIPALILLMLLAVSVPLASGHYHRWLVPLARGVFLAQNWAMVEVFIIGVIVALVKISAMATVKLGISFWAYAAFSICFTMAVAVLDRYQCWERIEALQGTSKDATISATKGTAAATTGSAAV